MQNLRHGKITQPASGSTQTLREAQCSCQANCAGAYARAAVVDWVWFGEMARMVAMRLVSSINEVDTGQALTPSLHILWILEGQQTTLRRHSAQLKKVFVELLDLTMGSQGLKRKNLPWRLFTHVRKLTNNPRLYVGLDSLPPVQNLAPSRSPI